MNPTYKEAFRAIKALDKENTGKRSSASGAAAGDGDLTVASPRSE